MSLLSINQSASATPFDNTTNGFVSIDVQAAIEESKNTATVLRANVTASTTTSSGTFSVIGGATLTPAAGTYLVIWSGSFAVTSGANGSGEISIFLGGTQQAVTTRTAGINVALLLGLIGTSTVNPGGDSSITTLVANGSQAIDVRFRSVSGDTMQCSRGNLILLRIA